jgi:Flp pilus assembly protein TadB
MWVSPHWWPAVLAPLTVVLWPSRSSPVGPPAGTLGASDADGRPPPNRASLLGRALSERLQRHAGAARGAPASDLADALVLVALALRSGLALVEALEEVLTDSTGPVRADLAAVVAALRWGQPAARAWGFAGPAWQPVGRVWQVAEATGGGPAEVLAAAAQRLRDAHEQDLERRAARAGVLLVLPLGLAFLPAFALTALVPIVLALAHGLGLG